MPDTTELNEPILQRVLKGQTAEVQQEVRRRLRISHWSSRPIEETPPELWPEDSFAELPDPDFEDAVSDLVERYYAEGGTT